MKKMNTTEIEDMDIENFTIQHKKGVLALFIVITILGAALVAFSLLYRNETSHWLIDLLFFSLFAGSFMLTLEFARWKLIVEGDTFTIRNWTGKIKTMKIDEITSIKSIVGGCKVYKGKKKLFEINGMTMDILKFALFCNKFREKMESVQHQEDFLLSQANPEESEREICILGSPRAHMVIGLLGMVTSLGMLIFVNIIEMEGGSVGMLLVNGMFLVITLQMIHLFIKGVIWRIKVTSKALIIRNVFGREKHYPIHQISYVQKKLGGDVILFAGGRRIAKFNPLTKNWDTLQLLLETKVERNKEGKVERRH